eukprot:9180537-Pyramimonas_sp.AAC.1
MCKSVAGGAGADTRRASEQRAVYPLTSTVVSLNVRGCIPYRPWLYPLTSTTGAAGGAGADAHRASEQRAVGAGRGGARVGGGARPQRRHAAVLHAAHPVPPHV